MSDRIARTARRFTFDFPSGLWRETLERLRGTPPRVEDRLRGLPPDLLVRRDGERWSIQEHAGHLLDLEELFLGRLDDFEANVGTMRAADMTNRKTYDARHNERRVAEILTAFRRERARLVGRLQRPPRARFARAIHHPRLDQDMRLVDLMYFQAEHDDLHLARITEMIARFHPSGA